MAALLAAGPTAVAQPLRVDTSASVLAIHVSRSGLFSGFAHNHRFVPQRWHAEVTFDPARPAELEVVLVVDAGSLHDHESRLADASRAQVDRTTAGPEVLDAGRFPEIRYRASKLAELKVAASGEIAGVLHGELTLHGTRKPLAARFRARPDGPGFRATGSARFAQSDFGMKPYSTALGTIGVDDDVEVEFDLILLPLASAVLSRQGEAGPLAPEAAR